MRERERASLSVVVVGCKIPLAERFYFFPPDEKPHPQPKT
jgi:hypothetical protein